ncbi:YhgE/Pip domain-containing protein [Microbacterium sp. bgisy207]|uniref:YhgE/Pip domain-containing protein n=1 Tax=Microbacterium sp. bgisy207 TaxID=3413800 RepID=UPI003EB6D6A6
MSMSVERARSRKPITWLTILGVILLPAVIGGILVVALYDPTTRLDTMNAAIVNEDEPVTIDGQYVPLGRQLSAGLVEGSGDADSNLTWTISNADDAAAGLADGTYAAVVTIPENFSAAATSTRPGETPEQATIEVTTPPDSLIVDDAITAQITSTAATLTGEQISTQYLENVFLGFTTLGDQLGEAAGGADQLADGIRQSADGSAELAGGIDQLASGAGALGSGLGTLATSTSQAAGGAAQLAAAQNQIADGLDAAPLPGAANEMYGYMQSAAAETVTVLQGEDGKPGALALAQKLGALAATCDGSVGYCQEVAAAAANAATVAQNAGAAATAAGTAAGYGENVVPGISTLISQTSAGLRQVATQTQSLADGLVQLADGTTQSQSGAQSLQSGAAQAATGATSLTDGLTQLAGGATSLADGLHTAVEELPSYTDAEAASLAEVVADPVAAEGVGSDLFGASAIPLLTALALWFGALGSFVALRAFPARTLASRAASPLLALRSFVPAAAIGAVQGLLVAGIVQISAGYDWGDWSIFAGVSILAGVAFAAVNQALVAVFGGAGRWIAALIGVLAVATGIVSTVPGVLTAIDTVLPISPAYNAMLGALTGSGGVGAGVAGLLIWGGLAFVATILAVAARRTTTARAILASSAAS